MIPVRLGVTVAMIATLLSVGCHWIRRTRKPQPPVVVAAPQPEPRPAPEPVAVESPEPPKIDRPSVSSIPQPPGEPVPAPEPPAPKPRRARKPAPPAVPKEPEKVGPVAIPQLSQLLTDQQRTQYSREIDEFLKRVDETLETLSARSLTGEQRISRDRIRALAGQAREKREADPATARGLAERADLLARELERSSR